MSAQEKSAPLMMTIEAYIDWSRNLRPAWELHFGHPVEMSAESVAHSDVQYAMRNACEEALPPGSRCRPKNGQGVVTGANDVRIPDLYIECRPDDTVRRSTANEPTVVFEVSVTSLDYDLGDKRVIYFNNPHVMHYVVVIPETRLVHHWKRGDERPVTFQHEGTLDFSPHPNIVIDIERFWVGLPPFAKT